MAFQAEPSFAEFLRETAKSKRVEESGPAANFLLEERLTREREIAHLPPSLPLVWNISEWHQAYGNFYAQRVAISRSNSRKPDTFLRENQENILSIESHQDVIRIESLISLYQRAQGDYESVTELERDVVDYVSSLTTPAANFDIERRSRLSLWIDELNGRRDARPTFVAPFDEVEPLLAQKSWASLLRDKLGLAHLGGSHQKPLPVILLRYNLSRVEREAQKQNAVGWAAAPTILEAGGIRGPGPAFFPFPKAAASSNPVGFGVTVNLEESDCLDLNSELLHICVDYRLEDICKTGYIESWVDDAALLSARRRHFGLMEPDFVHRKDVP